jgi:hypothetical protein
MTAPRHKLHAAQKPAVPLSDLQWQSATRAYRIPHRNDWLVLAFFSALPLATGLDIAYELGWSSQAGRLAVVVALVIAGLWGATYYALKIAVLVRVSAVGLSVHQGPWHGEIAWRELARLSERARPTGPAAERWIVAEAVDARRLTIPATSLADYEGFVHDINATFTDWRTHAAEPLLDSKAWGIPLLATERPRPVAWLLASGLSVGMVGVVLLTITRGWSWPGALPIAVGMTLVYFAARRRLVARTVQLNDEGVQVRTRLGASTLAWTAITGVGQHRGRISAAARLTDRLLGSASRHLLSLDRWTDGVPWPRPLPAELVIKGAGKRLRVRLDRIEAPEELQAHLEARLRLVAQMRAAAPPVRRITQRLASVPRSTALLDGAHALQAPTDAAPPT